MLSYTIALLPHIDSGDDIRLWVLKIADVQKSDFFGGLLTAEGMAAKRHRATEPAADDDPFGVGVVTKHGGPF